VGRVLGVGVLAVVQQQVGVERERMAGDPRGLELGERPDQRRLVIGQVAERRARLGDAVAKRRPAMVDGLGADAG